MLGPPAPSAQPQSPGRSGLRVTSRRGRRSLGRPQSCSALKPVVTVSSGAQTLTVSDLDFWDVARPGPAQPSPAQGHCQVGPGPPAGTRSPQLVRLPGCRSLLPDKTEAWRVDWPPRRPAAPNWTLVQLGRAAPLPSDALGASHTAGHPAPALGGWGPGFVPDTRHSAGAEAALLSRRGRGPCLVRLADIQWVSAPHIPSSPGPQTHQRSPRCSPWLCEPPQAGGPPPASPQEPETLDGDFLPLHGGRGPAGGCPGTRL